MKDVINIINKHNLNVFEYMPPKWAMLQTVNVGCVMCSADLSSLGMNSKGQYVDLWKNCGNTRTMSTGIRK